MARAKNRIIRQCQNLFAVVPHRVWIRNCAAAHGTGEHRIANYRNSIGQSGHHVGNAAARMAACLSRINFQRPNRKFSAHFKRLRSVNRLELAHESFRLSDCLQPREVRNMVGMRVGEQNHLYLDVPVGSEFHHVRTIRAGVERCALVCFRIPDQE